MQNRGLLIVPRPYRPLGADPNANSAIDTGASVDIDQAIGPRLERGAFKPGRAVAAADTGADLRHADSASRTFRFAYAAGRTFAAINSVGTVDFGNSSGRTNVEADVAVGADATMETAVPGLRSSGIRCEAEIDLIKIPN